MKLKFGFLFFGFAGKRTPIATYPQLNSTTTIATHSLQSAVRNLGFKCPDCMKYFTRKDHLRTHYKNLHGEDVGPFACLACSQLYKNADSLRKHVAKYHAQNAARARSGVKDIAIYQGSDPNLPSLSLHNFMSLKKFSSQEIGKNDP